MDYFQLWWYAWKQCILLCVGHMWSGHAWWPRLYSIYLCSTKMHIVSWVEVVSDCHTFCIAVNFFLPSHHHKHDIVRTFEDEPDISKDFRRFTTTFQRFTKIFQVFSSPISKISYAKSNSIPVAFHLKVKELYHSVHLLVFSLTGSRFHIVKPVSVSYW